MTKLDLLRAVSEKSGITHKDIDIVLAAYADVVVDTLKGDKDERIPFPGLGTFKAKAVPERTGIVQIGETKGDTWVKPAHTEIKFTITKSVKEI